MPRSSITRGERRTSEFLVVKRCRRCNLIIPFNASVKFWDVKDVVGKVILSRHHMGMIRRKIGTLENDGTLDNERSKSKVSERYWAHTSAPADVSIISLPERNTMTLPTKAFFTNSYGMKRKQPFQSH